MKHLVSLAFIFVSAELCAEANVSISAPFSKGECVVSYSVNNEIIHKKILQKDAMKLSAPINKEKHGSACSEKLKSSLAIDPGFDCRLFCNLD